MSTLKIISTKQSLLLSPFATEIFCKNLYVDLDGRVCFEMTNG